MKTIKIIDLLNKIANGEEVPKKIKYLIYEYTYNDNDEEYQRNQNRNIIGLGEDRRLDIVLCDEVEIIEEDKKIEKILPTSLKGIDNLDEKIEVAHIDTISAIDKINEIIDYINKNEENK